MVMRVLPPMLGADKALAALKRHWHVRQAACLEAWRLLAAPPVRDGGAQMLLRGGFTFSQPNLAQVLSTG